MRVILFSAAVALVAGLPAGAADDSINVNDIIQKFVAKETQFAQARNDYTYRQSVKLQELEASGNPTGGQWEQVSDILFSPEGRRLEKVVYAPVQSLQNILLTPEDMADLINVNPFVLTTAEIPEFEIHYEGRETLYEVDARLRTRTGASRRCYTFSMRPKTIVKGKRYFEGKVWVDDHDGQVVKTYGKSVSLADGGADRFPRIETDRGQIDGKYWFPIFKLADDSLRFSQVSQRVRIKVSYSDYRKYDGVRFGDTKSTRANEQNR